jgi:hypothetical protein
VVYKRVVQTVEAKMGRRKRYINNGNINRDAVEHVDGQFVVQ